MSDTESADSRYDLIVMKGVDPEDVEVDADGTHRGPPRFRESSVETATGDERRSLSMYCPCGHYIRETTRRYKPMTVECQGSLPEVGGDD